MARKEIAMNWKITVNFNIVGNKSYFKINSSIKLNLSLLEADIILYISIPFVSTARNI